MLKKAEDLIEEGMEILETVSGAVAGPGLPGSGPPIQRARAATALIPPGSRARPRAAPGFRSRCVAALAG